MEMYDKSAVLIFEQTKKSPIPNGQVMQSFYSWISVPSPAMNTGMGRAFITS